MQEIWQFCKKQSIPYFIAYQTADGVLHQTKDADRKAITLERIWYFVEREVIQPQTLFPKSVVCFDELPHKLKPFFRVFYGQYKNGEAKILELLKQLTGNQFQYGAIAQEVIREYWGKGIAPTYAAFAKKWLVAKKAHQRPNLEWAFLSDRSQGRAGNNWKKLRIKKANLALSILDKMEW